MILIKSSKLFNMFKLNYITKSDSNSWEWEPKDVITWVYIIQLDYNIWLSNDIDMGNIDFAWIYNSQCTKAIHFYFFQTPKCF